MHVTWFVNTDGLVAFTIRADNPAEAMVLKVAVLESKMDYRVDGYTIKLGEAGYADLTISPRGPQ